MRSERIYRVASWLTIFFPLTMLTGGVAQDIAMSLTAILFLLHCTLRKDWSWSREPWAKCLLLLWVYMILRGAVADYQLYAADHAEYLRNPFQATRRSLPFLRYLVFAAALSCWTLRDPVTRRRFFLILSWMVIGLAADCLLQWFAGKDILGRNITQSEGRVRLTGPFNSPMPGIILAWVYFPACLPLLINMHSMRRGIIMLGGVAACLFVLIVLALTGERMALILTLAGWGLAILLLPNMWRALMAVLAGGLLLLGIFTIVSPAVVGNQMRATRHTLEHLQESPYGILLRSDLRLAAENPIFGAGTNYFRILCPKLYPGYDEKALAPVCNVHPHNIYLEWLIENGAIGLGLFLAFIACTLKGCMHAWKTARSDPYFIGGLIAFFMRIWPIASSTSFFSPWGAPPFWLVAGIVLTYNAKRETKPAGV